MASKSDEKLHNIPEHDKGEADKETKGAAKVRDKGVKGVNEVLSQNGGAQRSVCWWAHADMVFVRCIKGWLFFLVCW